MNRFAAHIAAADEGFPFPNGKYLALGPPGICDQDPGDLARLAGSYVTAWLGRARHRARHPRCLRRVGPYRAHRRALAFMGVAALGAPLVGFLFSFAVRARVPVGIYGMALRAPVCHVNLLVERNPFMGVQHAAGHEWECTDGNAIDISAPASSTRLARPISPRRQDDSDSPRRLQPAQCARSARRRCTNLKPRPSLSLRHAV